MKSPLAVNQDIDLIKQIDAIAGMLHKKRTHIVEMALKEFCEKQKRTQRRKSDRKQAQI